MDSHAAGRCLDCVIPVHEKDFDSVGCTIASIRRCCPEVRRILLVGRTPWPGAEDFGAEWLDEGAACWPFKLSDFEGCGCQPGWLLQQLLKLYAPVLVPDITEEVLVCDADVIWLREQGVRFIADPPVRPGSSAVFICTFDSASCPPIRSAVDLHRYDKFLTAILPELSKPKPGKETAVCHHMCLQYEVVQSLFKHIEEAHGGQPFWQAFREAAKACGGCASEYELYYAFALKFFPERIVPRALPFAVVGGDLDLAIKLPHQGISFLVAHSHLRGLSPAELRDRVGVINGDVQAETLRRWTQEISPELSAIIMGSGML